MKKTATIVLIVIVGFVIAYGTVCLYMGNFEGAFATFPFLLFFYVFAVARQQMQRRKETDDEPDK
ncbi:MAG: hypothetical protein LLG06_12415 [Desulfobacteraceae bacterium]|nr:hypothetical protein [Desulfobacteraceae bacterium]